MSTSPSWFDQEKFARLKKVGPKAGPAAPPVPGGGEGTLRSTISLHQMKRAVAEPADTKQENDLIAPEEAAPEPREETNSSTPNASEISTDGEGSAPAAGKDVTSDPASDKVAPEPTSEAVLAESSDPIAPPRDIPAVDAPPPKRRTATLPGLKALLQYALPSSLRSTPSAPDPEIVPPAGKDAPTPAAEGKTPETPVMPPAPVAETVATQTNADLADAWLKIAQLNEEVTHLADERDQVVEENQLLRERLQQGNAAAPIEGHDESAAQLAQLTQERDDVLAENAELRAHLQQVAEPGEGEEAIDHTEELAVLTNERDEARRQYAKLREQFENLKREQEAAKNAPGKEDPNESGPDMALQVEDLRRQLAEREEELKSARSSASAGGDELEKVKQDFTSMKEALAKAQAEASVAQRGLALSQKALHETRDTLREATEGSALSRANFENLRNENSTLVQQNLLLQAQLDQSNREMSGVKAKITQKMVH